MKLVGTTLESSSDREHNSTANKIALSANDDKRII